MKRLLAIRPKKLQTRMILLILGLVVCITAVGGGFSLKLISATLERQIGQRALKVAQTVSLIPRIRMDLKRGDIERSGIQSLVEKIRITTGAQFIVVGDRNGIRYSHPVPERIGRSMVGGDNYPALSKGDSYISKATGTLGPSIRGKVPVFDDNGSITGVVSVGYLVQNVNSLVWGYHVKIIAFLTTVVLLGVVATLKITEAFKKAIFGLEPTEIAAMFQERTTTLETIREGVLAVNAQGRITTINRAALRTMGIRAGTDVAGRSVTDIFPLPHIAETLETGVCQLDCELKVGDKEIVLNSIPMMDNGNITGAVASFRNKDELAILAKKLSQIQKYSEMLRTQTHEYSNKLYTISGLIQIGAYQEVVDLIGSESTGYQELINTLMDIVPDPVLAGVIVGKYNKAKELKVDFHIDADSTMVDIPEHIKRERLVTVIGNILDNGFEAVLDNPEPHRRVTLAMTDLGNDLIFDVDDAGHGVAAEDREKIFTKGHTSKTQHGHGMGLFLVKKNLGQLNGSISVGVSDLGGAAFTVIIPKEENQWKTSRPSSSKTTPK